MAALARASLRLLLIAAALVVISLVIGQLWVIVLPILLALLLATALWPPTAWLRRKGLPPALAAVVTVLGALVVLSAAIAVIVPPVISQVKDIADSAADGLSTVQEWLTGPPLNLSDEQITTVRVSITDRLQDSASSIASGVITGVSAVTSTLVTIFVVLFLTFFFMKDGPGFLPWLRRLVGDPAGEHVDQVLRRSWRALGGFFRSQALVGLIDGLFIGIGLVILGVPLALPLAVLTFFGGFIPIVGAFVAGALAVLVALVTKGTTAAIIVIVIVFAVQQIEGNVLQPILQSRALRLHQAVILLAVTAGGTLYGVAGAFFAVPLAAVVAEAARYVNEQLDQRPGQARLHEAEEPERSGDGESLLGTSGITHPEPETPPAD